MIALYFITIYTILNAWQDESSNTLLAHESGNTLLAHESANTLLAHESANTRRHRTNHGQTLQERLFTNLPLSSQNPGG